MKQGIKLYWALTSAVTGSASISTFTSLVGGTSSVVGLKNCALIVGIEKYQSIIEKMKHSKIVLLAKTKLSSKEVFISRVFNWLVY